MKHKIALFVPSLCGGGAERVMVNLARGFAEQGHPVDLVLAKAEGPYLKDVPESVRIVDLASPRVLLSLPRLVKYLRRERPHALLSALDHANIVALWAKQLANVPTRVVVTIHSTVSRSVAQARNRRARLMPSLAKRFYQKAHNIVAVSEGVADDFSSVTGIHKNQIEVIYNPVITKDLFIKAGSPVDHPWFLEGQPPVVLGVGRLTAAKDFPTLVRAFALIRKEHSARLVILGEGEEREKVERLAHELGVYEDVWMPGFVENPYAFMSRARVFALSSLWEGLPTVIVESIALGIPVVSTDCKSGPREILEHIGGGTLVRVNDPEGLAIAIKQLINSESYSRESAVMTLFDYNTAFNSYKNVIL